MEFPLERRAGPVEVEPDALPAGDGEDIAERDADEASQEPAATWWRDWLGPFWLGCAVGAIAAAWLVSGGSSVMAPVDASGAVSASRPDTRGSDPPVVGTEAPRPAVPELRPVAPPPRGEDPPMPAGAPAAVRTATATGPSRPAETGHDALPAGREPRRFAGSLAVDSTPARARVFINGEPAGVTPVILASLPVGSRAVRVEADAHGPWWSVVQIVADQKTNLSVTLSPEGAPGPGQQP